MIGSLICCGRCGAIIAVTSADRKYIFKECPCGSQEYLTPAHATWRCSPNDQRLLKSLRIATD